MSKLGNRMAILVVVTLAAISAPPTMAGSPADPEMPDGTGEVTVRPAGYIDIAAPEIDIVRAWFTSNETHVLLHFEVVDIAERTTGSDGASYGVSYHDDAYVSAGFSAWRFGEKWYFWWFGWDGVSEFADASYVPATIEGNRITWPLPREHVHGPIMRPVASTLLSVDGPLGSGGPVWWRDAAPDYGRGRMFTP